MFLVWETAKALNKTPSEVWNMSPEDKRLCFSGIRYDEEQKVERAKLGIKF